MEEHKYIYTFCTNCGHSMSVKLKCGDRLCEECNQQNYYRLLNKYLPVIRKAKFLTQLTLTHRNFKYLTKERFDKLLSDFKVFRKHPDIRGLMRGGVAVVECKHVSDRVGWNLHLHVLLDTSFLNQKMVSRVWYSITKDSFIVDIRREESSTKAVFHLFKYLLKQPVLKSEFLFSDLDMRISFNDAFKFSRHVISFGSFYNAVPEDQLPYRFECPICGGVQFMTEFDVDFLSRRCALQSG